jgi:hypothetical protein
MSVHNLGVAAQLVAGIVCHLAPQRSRELGPVVAQQSVQCVHRSFVVRIVRTIDFGEFAGGGGSRCQRCGGLEKVSEVLGCVLKKGFETQSWGILGAGD